MCPVRPDPLSNTPTSPSMNYPTVPIKDVPAPGALDLAPASRRMVLVVDDESAIADTFSEILSLSGYAAFAAYDAVSALEAALLIPPDLAIIDAGLPGMSGVELAIALKSRHSECRILLLSEQSAAIPPRTSANSAGHKFVLLLRPVRPDVLLERVSASFRLQ